MYEIFKKNYPACKELKDVHQGSNYTLANWLFASGFYGMPLKCELTSQALAKTCELKIYKLLLVKHVFHLRLHQVYMKLTKR